MKVLSLDSHTKMKKKETSKPSFCCERDQRKTFLSSWLLTADCWIFQLTCFVHARVPAGVPEICNKTFVRHTLYNDSYNYYFYSFSITVISLLVLEKGFTMTPKRPSRLSITSACLSFNTFSPIFAHWNQTRKHRIDYPKRLNFIFSRALRIPKEHSLCKLLIQLPFNGVCVKP